MRILIYGTGAVGGYFGGRLAQAGHSVVFLARGANLRAIRENGLKIESPKGDFTIRPANALENIADVGPVDAVILGVKTWQVPAAAQSLAYLIPTKARVLTLQNGVEAPYQVAEVLGRDHVLGCVCKIIAALVAPGHIRHVGMDPTITLGELGNRQMSEQSAAITEALRSAGINVHETGNVESALWQKLLFIASMSGVGSVTRSSIGEVRELPETRQMLIEVMNEVREVAAAHGVILESSTVGQTVSFIDSLPPSGTASMQRDITSGRPSELEAIIGVIVKMAAALHVEVPTTRFIYSALLAQEQRNRSIQSPGATASGPSN